MSYYDDDGVRYWVFGLIVVAIVTVVLFFWWRGYYMGSCQKDGHTYDYCNAQFWQTF